MQDLFSKTVSCWAGPVRVSAIAAVLEIVAVGQDGLDCMTGG